MTLTRPVRELARQIRGVTYGKDEASTRPFPGSIPVLRAGNIQDSRLVLEGLVYVPSERVSDEQLLRRDDILVATSSGSLDIVGKAARVQEDLRMGFGAFCKVLRPGQAVEPRYFAHYFRTRAYRRLISSLAAGANINNLRNEHLDALLVPFPPVEEQGRLADILDLAEAVGRKRRQAIVLTKELLRSAFFTMFGDPSDNLKGWTSAPFDTLVASTQLGLVRAAAEQSPDRAYPYVRMNAIRGDGYLDTSSLNRVNASAAEAAHASLVDGDFLFNTRNSRELVGKAAVFHGSGPCLFNNNILRVRFREGIHSDYVNAYWQTDFAQRQLESRKAGTTSVVAIYYKSLATLPVPLPPAPLQEQYSRLCNKARATLSAQLASASLAEDLFDSLLARTYHSPLSEGATP